MAYTYSVMHLDKSDYNLKYKYGSNFTPTEITYHQTSNLSPSINERNYLNNRKDKAYVSFHIVVDESQAIECLPLNVTGWHSGDGSNGSGNKNSIGVEIARSTNVDLNLRDKAIDNGALLIANLMKQFNIPINKVRSHNHRSGKNCPHDIRGRYGEDKFRNLIQEYYNELTSPTVTQPSNNNSSYEVGNKVKVQSHATHYAVGGKTIPNWVKGSEYTVSKVDGNKLLLKEITSWVWDYDVAGINSSTSNNTASSSFNEYKVKIIANELNVREKADFESKVKATVKKNEIYTIVGESNGLGLLKSKVGYISLNSKYVTKL